MPKLNSAAVREALQTVPGWKRRGGEIHRRFTFDDFAAAFAFVTQVAKHAQAKDHHPDVDIRYNQVTLALSTHSEGGLTEKDFASARHYSTLARRSGG